MSRPGRFALGGLQTGISGALAMLAWLGLSSLFYRRTIWWVPNLFATLFSDSARLSLRFSRHTATGIALDLFVYGMLGSLFGLVWRDQRGGARLLWCGLAVGIAAWYLLVRVIWRSVSPEISLYTPDRQILIGNLIYGLMLTRFPKTAAGLNAGSGQVG